MLVKNGGGDMLGIDAEGRSHPLPCPERITPVDTTGAGDSFNGGYLSARLAGQDMEHAVARGHATAAEVIRRPGALIDPDLLRTGAA